MKKVLLFAIAVLFCGVIQSQVFKDALDYSRTTVVDGFLNGAKQHTQKVLYLEKNIHIALSKNNEGKSMFIWLEDGNPESAKSVTLNGMFNVKDFAIHNSTIYFCGSITNNSQPEAFVAYVDATKLFYSSGNSINLNPPKIKYTPINNIYQDNIYSIDRIEVFYNPDSNQVVVAGIGKMRYGMPPYRTIVHTQNVIEMVLTDPDEYYLDFFMLYTIKEDSRIKNPYDICLGATPIYALANSMEMFYVPTDTVGGCYHTKFADITETDNRIYLTAINYSSPSVVDAAQARYLDIISFDKITRQQQSNRIVFPFEIRQEYGVKTTHLYDDEIAVALSKHADSVNLSECCAFRVRPQDSVLFGIHNISIFDTIHDKPLIFDCEYLKATNELIVLKESIFQGERQDIVFHLSMDKNLTYPYTSRKYKINNTNPDDTLHWNDLQSSDSKNYTVSGTLLNKHLMLYDMKYDALGLNIPCFIQSYFNVSTASFFLTPSIPILEQCMFPTLCPTVINENELFITYGATPIYNAFIMKESIPVTKTHNIIIDCISSAKNNSNIDE